LYNIKNEINLNKKNIKNRFEDINFIIEKEKFYKLFIFKNKKFEESEINGIKCYFNLINLELKIYNFNSSIIDGYGFIFEYDYAINKAFQQYSNFVNENIWKESNDIIKIGISELEYGGNKCGLGCKI
jgi:hypothetical protein